MEKDSESAQKTQSGRSRFRVGLDDSEWVRICRAGQKIQRGLKSCRVNLEDSEGGE